MLQVHGPAPERSEWYRVCGIDLTKENNMISNKEFKSPSSIFRGAPFWSWNDKLEKKEIIWQIRDFKKRGLGGFFMHSRVGLITPYMGKEWMDIIKVSVKEAKKLGMKAYLYDEDRWPSGFAGGFVTERNSDFRQKSIICLKTKEDLPGLKFLYEYMHKGEIYYYYTRITPSNNPGFNGESYVDLLNPKTTDAFIDTTYEPYRKVAGGEFGKVVPAIFTDEPTFGLVSWVRGGEDFFSNFPWTDGFFAYFKKKNGYKIDDKIHFLNLQLEGYKKIRHDFWKTATEMFVENFTKRIGVWCGKNKINFTGHVLHEDTFNSQTHFVGAAMPHYEYMQWPGIDHLAADVDSLNGGVFQLHGTVKQCTSVAHQFEKERVMSELYGVGGWDFTFEDQKWLADWEYALGVNFRCQHLSLYTLKGCRKRDFPQAISYQQRWWKYYNMVEDYYGRLSYIMTRGKFTADTLLLHPISSAWSIFDTNNLQPTKELHDKFLNVSYWLSELHFDYDYGDELIMKKHAKVKDGRFIVNKMSYKTVVIPPSFSWFKSTAKLLAQFLKAGGKIVVIKPVPVMVEGVASTEIEKLFKHKNVTVVDLDKTALEKAMTTIMRREVTIKDASGKEASTIYYQHRVEGKKHIYFFANIDKYNSVDATISLNKYGRTELYDLETGKVKEISSLSLKFAPAQSRLIVLDEEKQPSYIENTEPKLSGEIKLGNKWEGKRLDHNALTLDFCKYKIMDNPWSKTVPVWKAQLELRKAFGIKEAEELRVNDGTQFWKSYPNMSVGWRSHVSLKFNFMVKDIPKKLLLAMEIPQRFELLVNDKKVAYVKKENNWWVDKEFRTLDIKKYVKKGNNEITLNFLHRQDIEIESMYLVGDFGVYSRDNEHYYIGKEPKVLMSGDWVKQGYPFYGGEMVYQQTVNLTKKPGEKLFLELGELCGVVAKVRVNGKDSGLIGWEPFVVDITAQAKTGKNIIEIELVSSLRNLLGPHHVKPGVKYWASAHSFQDGANWTNKYSLVPYGIISGVKVKKVG